MRQCLITLISISICDICDLWYMKYPTFNPCWSLTSMQCVMLHVSVVIKAKGSLDRYEAMPSPSSVPSSFCGELHSLCMNRCGQKWTNKSSLLRLFLVRYVAALHRHIQLPGCSHSLAIQYVQYDKSSFLLPSNWLLPCHKSKWKHYHHKQRSHSSTV